MRGATSYKDTKFGILPRSKVVKFEVEGVIRGLKYIDALFKKNKKVSVTSQLICRLHQVSFGWIFPDWAGKFRNIQVEYSGKEAPSYYKIPELVVNLCEDLKERLAHLPGFEGEQFVVEVVKLVSWFQHRFVYIHPFNDYNGRVARMLTIIILLNLGLPPIEIEVKAKEDRDNYIKAMKEADGGDYKRLENLISTALIESMNK